LAGWLGSYFELWKYFACILIMTFSSIFSLCLGYYILGSWSSLPYHETQGATKSPSSQAGLVGMGSPIMVTSPGGLVQVSSPLGGLANSPMSVASPNNSPNQNLATGNP